MGKHSQFTFAESDNAPLEGDTTAGRVLRISQIIIQDGTDASTLKCTVYSIWNGDAIGETDNIAKDATTGDFTLSANGQQLYIEASGLTGNAVGSLATVGLNGTGTAVNVYTDIQGNDIRIMLHNTTTGAQQDLTSLADSGQVRVMFLYITNA